MDKILRKDVLDAKGMKGIYEDSYHCVVLAKIKIKDSWEYGRIRC